MNKRIEELIQQSTIVYEQPIYSSEFNPTIVSVETTRRFDAEKFAESLVQDCLNIARAEANKQWLNDKFEAAGAAYNIDWKIKEHFGVK